MTSSSHVQVLGPLSPHAQGFSAELAALGYTPLSATNQIRLMAHMSRWLRSRRRELHALTPQILEDFLRSRRRAGYVGHISERGLAPLMTYLRRIHAVPTPSPPISLTEFDRLVDRYAEYLLRERDLASNSIRNCLRVARFFLTTRPGPDQLDLDRLSAADVGRFVLRECRCRSVGYSKGIVTALRSLLRFLHLEGRTPSSLAGAVPAVAGWRVSSLPRALEPQQVAQLLRTCDRRRAVGRRDYAILMVLWRLGLRAGEVAALELDDIDWKRGEIEVRGKGRRRDRLPLPSDVGQSLVDYLRRGRPGCACRAVFLRSRAPHRPIGRGAVTTVVYSASERAGMTRVSAHRLRHTAATEMLRRGGSLPEIAEVLRHRHIATTAIYAKVDRSALRTLARPWPGVCP